MHHCPSFNDRIHRGFRPIPAWALEFGILRFLMCLCCWGAISFCPCALRVWRKGAFSSTGDDETRFLLIVAGLTALRDRFLVSNQVRRCRGTPPTIMLFMIISFITSTGFGGGFYRLAPCHDVSAGVCRLPGRLRRISTAGGNKIIRNILSIKLVLLELKRL